MPFQRYIVVDGKRWRVEDAHEPPRPVGHDGHDEYAVVFTDEESSEERMGYLRDAHLAQAVDDDLEAAFRTAE